jgi:hypothetical protein
MDIERWLNEEIDKIAEKGISKSTMASFIENALARVPNVGYRGQSEHTSDIAKPS